MVENIIGSIAEANASSQTRDFRDLGERIYLSFSQVTRNEHHPLIMQHLKDFNALFNNLLRAMHSRDVECALLHKNLDGMYSALANSSQHIDLGALIKDNMAEIM